jgi:hypothetical protein
MALNPDQFNELLKNLDRGGKRTIAGERFIRHDELENRGLSPYHEESDASWGAGFVASDGYGLGHTPNGGLRTVYTPDGKDLEDVTTHKEGVAVIRQHRAGTHASQRPREPREPLNPKRFSGALREKVENMNNNNDSAQ